jgi:ankyrin repeat protein
MLCCFAVCFGGSKAVINNDQYFSAEKYIDNNDVAGMTKALKKGINPNVTNNYANRSLLMHAAENGSPEMVALLIKKGADPLLMTKCHLDLAIVLAITAKKKENCSILLPFVPKNGQLKKMNKRIPDCYKMNQRDFMETQRNKMLNGALRNEWYDVVDTLVTRGCDLRQSNSLVHACSEKNLSLVKYLLEKGVDPNRTIVSGPYVALNALYLAVLNYRPDIVEILLKFKANPNKGVFILKNAENGTGEYENALMAAKKFPNTTIADILRSNGAVELDPITGLEIGNSKNDSMGVVFIWTPSTKVTREKSITFYLTNTSSGNKYPEHFLSRSIQNASPTCESDQSEGFSETVPYGTYSLKGWFYPDGPERHVEFTATIVVNQKCQTISLDPDNFK